MTSQSDVCGYIAYTKGTVQLWSFCLSIYLLRSIHVISLYSKIPGFSLLFVNLYFSIGNPIQNWYILLEAFYP